KDDARRGALEQVLAAELAGGGFTVVGAEKTIAVWKDAAASAGDAFDPHTGIRNPAAYQTMRTPALAALKERLGRDPPGSPAVEIVTAGWSGGTARWDGVTDSASDTFLGGFDQAGTIVALSLRVRMHDTHDTEIYFGTGGIQVAAKLRVGFFRPEWFESIK